MEAVNRISQTHFRAMYGNIGLEWQCPLCGDKKESSEKTVCYSCLMGIILNLCCPWYTDKEKYKKKTYDNYQLPIESHPNATRTPKTGIDLFDCNGASTRISNALENR
jgi:hypothetical protein